MKFFSYGKDGGPESKVWGLYIIEIKSLFSIVLLNFKNGSREAYHTHAFNAWSWVLFGTLFEQLVDGRNRFYWPSIYPEYTSKATFHKVSSIGNSWVLSFRGPWDKYWMEYVNGGTQLLTHGRQVV